MQLKQLITSARQYLQDNGYTASTIYHNYVWHWNTFLKSVGDSEYSYGLLTGYVIRRFSRNIFQSAVSDMKQDEYRNYHALLALDTFYNEEVMPGTSMSGAAIRQPLTEMSDKAFHLYMDSLELLEYTHNSKHQANTIVHAFLLACPIEGIADNTVIDYLVGLGRKAKSTVKSELKLLKRFLYFAWECSITENDYGTLLISTKKRKNTDIPSVYSPAEVVTLLNYLASHGKNRLRNFAIALLIAVYGFRAGDIAKMKLADIDWDTGMVIIIQAKSTRRLEHKLTELCGKALAVYLLNERPGVNSEHVFLKGDGKPLAATSVSTMVFNGFSLCSVAVSRRKHGSHSLRHSLASNMLEQGTGILEISHVLGHASADTTKNIYTKVDINHLRLCELEVPADE